MSTFLFTLALFGAVAAYGQLVANSRYLSRASETLRAWAVSLPPPTPLAAAALVAEARQRAQLYDDQIVAKHLVDGMVVNKELDGNMLDQCDSLLFSSLRYASLVKLGATERAAKAWSAIEKSQVDGHWLRHPRCPKSTSRDMLVGLLIALAQHPPNAETHLKSLLKRVGDHNGYFSTGPIYVSYLTPGLARFLAMLAPGARVSDQDLPDIVRDGYSTAELEVMVVDEGYEAHLGGLSAWLEMELAKETSTEDRRGSWPVAAVDEAVKPFASPTLEAQRLEWITDRLMQVDGTNLFFRYLRLRAAGALTPAVRERLLGDLLSRSQFPADRLPEDCDRKADYLWQRNRWHRWHHPVDCSVEYSGVDYLWMTALLLDGWNVDTKTVAH